MKLVIPNFDKLILILLEREVLKSYHTLCLTMLKSILIMALKIDLYHSFHKTSQ